MDYVFLPLTEDVWQVFTIDLQINGEPFHAQVELRYLPAPNQWYISIWDHSTSELLVNQIPVICSYDYVNDLLIPFAALRDGKGLGSLFCSRASDSVSSVDPAKGNLTEFSIVWGKTYV